jgi:prepilin signal peptidase PulO-like enzyme (type II secretory pathway)
LSLPLTVAAWAAVGVAAGVLIRAASVWLARLEGLQPGFRAWQVYGPPLLTGLLFAAFALRVGPHPELLLRSLWVMVLVQVIFFDFEHRLILDRLILPSMVAALALSFFTPHLDWKASLVAGIGTGLLFLLIAVLGAFVFKAEAMGFGDVKLSVFIGLILGLTPTVSALFLGIFLAGATAIALVAMRLRSLKDSIAYGPFLAAGTLVALFQVSGH